MTKYRFRVLYGIISSALTKKPLGGGIDHRNPSCSESSLKTIEDLFSIVYFFKLAQSLAHIARKTFSVSSPFNWYRSWYRVFSNHFFFFL